jgi:hypothetical protein
MLVRITRSLSSSIDGMQLGRFALGEVYDVGTSVGSYLLAMGAAEPVADHGVESAHSASNQMFARDRSPRPQPPANQPPADRAPSDETPRQPALPRATAWDQRPRKKKR